MIHDIMIHEIVRIPAETGFDLLLKRFGEERESRLMYIEDKDGTLLGIISGFDLLRACCGAKGIASMLGLGEDPSVCEALKKNWGKKASDFMVKDFVSVGPLDDVKKAVEIIVDKRFLALPVVGKDGKAVGEVTRRKLLKVLSDMNWEEVACR